MMQFLDPDGNLTIPEGYEEEYAQLTPEMLRGFYRDMAVTRRFDAEGISLQRQGKLALWVPSRGQEAAQIGLAHAMAEQDFAFPTYREHGVAYVRGVPVEQLFDVFMGVHHSGLDPQKHRFHHYTVVLASQTLHAAGYAMGAAWDAQAESREPGEATVAFFGDGASSEGDVHEAMVFAASYEAPVLFFNQNNQWAISVPLEVQTKVPLADRAQGYGFPGVRIDGNDVIGSYLVSQRMLADIRAGKGPAMIEAFTYRILPHTTADDATKYRGREEELEWEAKCPLARMEKFLRSQGLADDAFFEEVQTLADAQAMKVREHVLQDVEVSLEDSFRTVYAEPHSLIQEELKAYKEYEAGFED